MVDYADIGKRIRACRLAKGMTQEQLADCSADEAKIIKETVVSLKKSLRKVYGKSSKYRYD